MNLQSRIKVEKRSIAPRDEISFECRVPPSTNSLFYNRQTGGRGKSAAYRTWLKESGWMIMAARLGHISGPVSIKIAISNSAKLDIDNANKALIDLCVRQNLIEDDGPRFVRGLSVDFADIDGAKVTIRRVTA